MRISSDLRQRSLRAAALTAGAALAFFVGCSGSVSPKADADDEPMPEPDPGPEPGTPDEPKNDMPPEPIKEEAITQPSCGIAAVSPRLRRLSNFELVNSVRDLFGIEVAPTVAAHLVGDNQVSHYDNNERVQTVLAAEAKGYLRFAEDLAGKLTADVAGLTRCGANDKTCIETYLTQLAYRAYRRPLSDGEKARLVGLFNDLAGKFDIQTGLSAGLEFVLQAPEFLYKREGVGSKDAFDVATRLSYLLWGSLPDADLLAAAAADKLREPSELEAQTRRMLNDPRARSSVKHFFHQLLLLEEVDQRPKDPALFPSYDESTVKALHAQADRFIEHVVFDDGVKPLALFGAHYNFYDQKLGTLYDKDANANTFEKKDEDPSRSAGILTSGAVLAGTALSDISSPILRGKLVRERILCTEIAPPSTPVPDLPASDTAETTREIFEQHSSDPACNGCHRYLDPIGFAFENFDAIGRWRDKYPSGANVDASGELAEAGDASGAISGVGELGDKLGASDYVARCMARQMLQFSVGRDLTADDQCAMDWLAWDLGNNGSASVVSALERIATSALVTGRP